jgi:hypothetical protein
MYGTGILPPGGGKQLNDISGQLYDVTMGNVAHSDALDEPT